MIVEVFTKDCDYPAKIKTDDMWDCLGDHGFCLRTENSDIFIPYENIRQIKGERKQSRIDDIMRTITQSIT